MRAVAYPRPKPLHALHVADARRHLEQAIASLRAAAALDPFTARAASSVHVGLIDQLESLKELSP